MTYITLPLQHQNLVRRSVIHHPAWLEQEQEGKLLWTSDHSCCVHFWPSGRRKRAYNWSWRSRRSQGRWRTSNFNFVWTFRCELRSSVCVCQLGFGSKRGKANWEIDFNLSSHVAVKKLTPLLPCSSARRHHYCTDVSEHFLDRIDPPSNLVTTISDWNNKRR
jgi:hypothetical protein